MGFINHFFIKINSKKVGADEFGNQYFEKKNSCEQIDFISTFVIQIHNQNPNPQDKID